jgi:hypothetical protein
MQKHLRGRDLKQGDIRCPSCKFGFPLDEVLLESIKDDIEGQLNEKRQVLVNREKQLKANEKQLEGKVEAELNKREDALRIEANKKAKDEMNFKLAILENALQDKNEVLEKHEKDNLELLAKERKHKNDAADLRLMYEKERLSFEEGIEEQSKSKLEEFKVKFDQEKNKFERKVKEEADKRISVELEDAQGKKKEAELRATELEATNFKFRQREKEVEEKEKNFKEIVADEKIKAREEAEREINKQHNLEIDREKKKSNEQRKLLNDKLNKALEKELKFIKDTDKLMEEINNKEREYLKKRSVDREQMRAEIQNQANEKHEIEVDQAKRKLDEEYRLKEKKLTLKYDSLKRETDSLQRKLDQGSQQVQGEVAELELTEILNREFPEDEIKEIRKGERGADLVQTVRSSGKEFGKIIWEVKNTKNWSDRWIPKLKDDQGEVNADICVLVTKALPQDASGFYITNDVYVTKMEFSVSLATLFRVNLMQVYRIKKATEGSGDKKDRLFKYITGSEFVQRIKLKISTIYDMKRDLEKEKGALTRQWAKREKQIEKVFTSTVELWGDFDGILDPRELPKIEGVDSFFLEEEASD